MKKSKFKKSFYKAISEDANSNKRYLENKAKCEFKSPNEKILVFPQRKFVLSIVLSSMVLLSVGIGGAYLVMKQFPDNIIQTIVSNDEIVSKAIGKISQECDKCDPLPFTSKTISDNYYLNMYAGYNYQEEVNYVYYYQFGSYFGICENFKLEFMLGEEVEIFETIENGEAIKININQNKAIDKLDLNIYRDDTFIKFIRIV